MVLCQRYGHSIVALANLLPPQNGVDDMDSYMYQTVGHQVIASYAQCMGLPLYRRRITGSSKEQGLVYHDTTGDEVEDLAALLSYIKSKHPEIEAVSSGAIASDYQRTRIERVCSRIGLVSLAYMWHQPQDALLRGMIHSSIHAILIKIAAAGLYPKKHLGASLSTIEHQLHELRKKYGSNICGEGGEYESLTLDCPLFTQGRIVVDSWDTVLVDDDSLAPVAFLRPSSFHVQGKNGTSSTDSVLSLSKKSTILESVAAGAVIDVPDEYIHELYEWPLSRDAIDAVYTSTIRNINSIASSTSWDAIVNITPPASETTVTARTISVTVPGSTKDCSAAVHVQGALASALDAVHRALQTFHVTWHDIIFVHLFVPDMTHFVAANEVYSQYFPCVNPPARATVQLADNDDVALLIEVLVGGNASISANNNNSNNKEHARVLSKKVLHVQSISAWAPSCIGPYSQAVLYKGLLHFAGQIPLEPPTMVVIESSNVTEHCMRSMQSCQAVAIAMQTDLANCMLWCCVYTSQNVSSIDLSLIETSIKSFLSSPPPPTTTTAAAAAYIQTSPSHHANNNNNNNNMYEYDGDEVDKCSVESLLELDDYLKPPSSICMATTHWNIQYTYLQMPVLPRNALLEIQPVAWSHDPSMPGSLFCNVRGYSDDDEENDASSKSDSDSVMPSWVSRLESRNREESIGPNVRLSIKTLASMQYMARIQVFLYYDHVNGEDSAVTDDTLMEHAALAVRRVNEELHANSLSFCNVAAVKVHAAPAVHQHIHALRAAIRSELRISFDGNQLCDTDAIECISIVPVLRVAESSRGNGAVFEIEVLAWSSVS